MAENPPGCSPGVPIALKQPIRDSGQATQDHVLRSGAFLRKRTCDLSQLTILHEHLFAPEIPRGLPNCEEL